MYYMGPSPTMGRGNFEGGMGHSIVHCKVLGRSAVICAKTGEPIKMTFELWARMGIRNRVLDGVQIPHGKGQFWGKERPL